MENAGARASVAGKIGGIVVVASNNAHKIEEIKTILGAVMPDAEFKAMGEVGGLPEPEETGTTFEENAFIKAETIHAATGLPTVADDSGLMVDALDGAPGVYSARYAGVHGDDAANNALLLHNLKGVPAPRKARYVAAIALVRPAHAPIICRGTCEGEILNEPRGQGGFGYDPLFLCETGETFAEISRECKNAISHRKRGIEAVLRALEEQQ